MYTYTVKIWIVTLWKKVRQIYRKNVVQKPKKKFLPITMLHLLFLNHSQKEKRKPDQYGISWNLATLEEQVSSLMQKEWIDAMNSEMDSLLDNDVWDIAELPKGKNV